MSDATRILVEGPYRPGRRPGPERLPLYGYQSLNASLPPPGSGPRMCTKRSQKAVVGSQWSVGRAMCKTKPIWPGIGFQGSGISELTPDPRPLTPGAPEATVQNEPNSARPRRGWVATVKDAKRSQTWGGWSIWGTGACGAIAPNKANCRPTGLEGKYLAEKELCQAGPAEGLEETKPIVRNKANSVSAGVCRPDRWRDQGGLLLGKPLETRYTRHPAPIGRG